MKAGDKKELTLILKVKKSEENSSICVNCALRVGHFSCYDRKSCPDDGTGLNYYFEGTK